jgi:hypothetical protein
VSAEDPALTGQTTSIEINEAVLIAELNVKDIAVASPDFAEWADSSIRLSKTYYDLNDKVTAYAFDVIVDEEYAGYILVSATTDKYPILEVTKGNIPGTDDATTRASGNAINKYVSGTGLSITESRPLYLGSLSYYRKYSTENRDGIKEQDIFVDERTGQIAEFPKQSMTEATLNTVEYEEMQVLKRADIKQQWEKQRVLISGSDPAERTALMNSVQATRSSKYVYGVPLFKQDSTYNGCSPMASAMVVSFWSTHGYPALPSDRATLFTQLANQMGTGTAWPFDGVTWPWRIESAIDRVFYSYTSLSPASNDYFPGWSGFVSEINSGRPFVLSMHVGGTAVGNTQAYGDHSVAVVGYVSSINNFVTIHDTWDDTNFRLLADGNWDNIMTSWVRP